MEDLEFTTVSRERERSRKERENRRIKMQKNAKRQKVILVVVFAVGITVLIGLCCFLMWDAFVPKAVTISVNGAPVKTNDRMTIQQAVNEYCKDETINGNLLSFRGELLTEGGGKPSRITVNDVEVEDLTATFADHDQLVVTPGVDRTEKVTYSYDNVPNRNYVSKGLGAIRLITTIGSKEGTMTITGVDSGFSIRRVMEKSPNVVSEFSTRKVKKKLVALTFDDGPHGKYTPQILDILKEKKAKATFFMLGTSVKKNPKIAKRVAKEGHMVATHTYSHKRLPYLKQSKIAREIDKAQVEIAKVTGVTPTWGRPPYGVVSGDVYYAFGVRGLTMAMWDVDTLDYEKNRSASTIVSTVKRHTRKGSVILMHDGGPPRDNLVAALPSMIDWLHSQGYQLVTLEELSTKLPAYKKAVKKMQNLK